MKAISVLALISCISRENPSHIEGLTDSALEDKYQFTWIKKGVRCYPKFQLYWANTYENRGPR